MKNEQPSFEETAAEYLRRASKRKRRPGSANSFDWYRKDIKEWGVAVGFVEAVGPKLDVKEIIRVRNDPPDCEILLRDGSRLGLEITELVDQETIERASKTQNRYDYADWPASKITSALETIIQRKDGPNGSKRNRYSRYILLIHSDEPMLRAQPIEKLLSALRFKTHLIDEIYLLLGYDAEIKNYPVFSIRVEKLA